MLAELTVENLAIIDRLTLKFAPGFNVLTGETGAGKSIIIDAVSLLLGGRATTDLIRSGAKQALVEGVFRVSPALQTQINPILEREGLEDDPEVLFLGREIRANGRNFCRVNGRRVSVSLLAQVAEPLVDIHGQHHHLSLLQTKMHRDFLDRFGNLRDQRVMVAQTYKKLQVVSAELRRLQQDALQIARRIDQLTFQVEEIEQADLQPDEEDALTLERTRLANAEKLNQLSGEAYRLLSGDGDEQTLPLSDLTGEVVRLLNNLAKVDTGAETLVNLAENISYQLEDLAGQLQDYGQAIEFSPTRLQEVEERLGLIYNLKRKYGRNIPEILTFAKNARTELESITNIEDRIEQLQTEREAMRHTVGQRAAALSEQRAQAGAHLAKGVETELQALGMANTRFAVALNHTPDPNGVYVGEQTLVCDETGIDQVVFMIAPNPGEPLKPMAKIASGGETSRLMLALKTVLAQADHTPSLIFDEIDQGIGGRIGGVVGQKLWGLTAENRHQVLCITHLPQIGAYGDIHFHVRKAITAGRTTTTATSLSGEDRIRELAQMLGGAGDGAALTAREILSQAEGVKNSE